MRIKLINRSFYDFYYFMTFVTVMYFYLLTFIIFICSFVYDICSDLCKSIDRDILYIYHAGWLRLR